MKTWSFTGISIFINGWCTRVIRVRQAIYLLGLLLWFYQLSAEEQDELPSMELLEFLGDAENIDGQWLDPLNMIELRDNEQASGQQEKRDED